MIRKFRLFLNPIEGQEKWLNERVKEGLKLSKVWRFIYKFEKCKPNQYQYAVDYIGNKSDTERKAYESLLDELGIRYYESKRQLRPTYQLLFCDEIMSLSSPRELTQMAKQEKQRLWEERIEAFLASGQSQRAWCQEQGLRANQLGYWLRKYKARMSQSAGKRWISMESESHSHSGVSLRIGNIVLDIEPGFSRQVLVDVLHSLMNVC